MQSDFQQRAEDLYQAGVADGFRAGFVNTIKKALEEAALSAAEPVAWVDEQELRYLEMVSGIKAWTDFQRNIKVGGEKEGRAPLYAAPPAPSVAVKADESPMRFFSSNVDNWGALEWFNRMADACEDHDRKRRIMVQCADEEEKEILEISADTSKMVMTSSAFHLARECKNVVVAALSAQVQDVTEIMATQIAMGHGKVDVSRIEHEGRAGILFRPRASVIPVGQEGELPAGEYWPVSGDVVIWIANEGGAQVIEKYLKDFLPTVSAQVQDVAGMSDDAIAVVWKAAMTVAANIIIKRQNDLNDDDGPMHVLEEQGECISAIKKWMEVDEPYLQELRHMLPAAPAKQEG